MAPDPFEILTKSRYAFLVAIDGIAKKSPDYPKGGLVRPEYLVPGYRGPSRADEVLVTALSLGPLAVITVCIRFVVVKRWPGLSIGAEDWMLIPATIFLIGLIAVHVVGARNGIGRHMYDTTWPELELIHTLSEPNLQLYAWSIYFSKLSNLFFTRRITPEHMRKTHFTIYFLFVFQTIWTLLASFLVLFSCMPVRATWDLAYQIKHGAKCFNQARLAVAASALFAIGDLATMILPVMLVLQLELPRRTRIGVAILFAFGSFVSIANLVKIKYFVHLYQSWDSTWNAVNVLKWSMIETSFALITVCLPALDMLLVKLIPNPVREKLRAADARREDTQTMPSENFPSAAKLDFVASLVPPTRDSRATNEKTSRSVTTVDEEEASDARLDAFLNDSSGDRGDRRKPKKKISTSWLSLGSDDAPRSFK